MRFKENIKMEMKRYTKLSLCLRLERKFFMVGNTSIASMELMNISVPIISKDQKN